MYNLANFYFFNIKIYKSNTEVSTHYRIIFLYSVNICYNIFVSYEFFNFFWNMFNSETIKIYYVRSDLKICWFAVTQVCFFSTPGRLENNFLSFWDGKDSIKPYLLNLISNSSCVKFFCNKHATNMNLTYLFPLNLLLAG